MLFSLTRVVIWNVVLIAIIIVLIKKRKQKKSTIIAVLILWAIVSSASALIPVENIFVNFKSPEDAFHYVVSEKYKIYDIVDGRDSCAVIAVSKDDLYTPCFLLKSDDRYKISTILYYEKASWHDVNGNNFTFYHVRGTEDYYIIGRIHQNEDNLTITDNRGSEFEYIATENSNSAYFSTVTYAAVNRIDDDYCMFINGIPVYSIIK